MHPVNSLVGPMLTDLYQLTMAYAYWKGGHHRDDSVFDLFFRRNPFGGEFTIFAGLEEVLRSCPPFDLVKMISDISKKAISHHTMSFRLPSGGSGLRIHTEERERL